MHILLKFALTIASALSAAPSADRAPLQPGAAQPSPSGSIESTAGKNVVLFLLDDPTLDAMRTFSRLHLYQRKIDGTIDPVGTPPEESLYFAKMPHVERMSSEGVTFSEFRVMPLCSPSRACLLTGMYAFKRHGQGMIQRPWYVWDDHFEFNSQPGFVYPVISDFIHAGGAKASMVGKWHLAQPTGSSALPGLHGFTGTGWPHIGRTGKWDSYIASFGNLRRMPIPDKNGAPASSSQGTYYHYFIDDNGVVREVTNPENEAQIAPSNRNNLDRSGYLTRTQALDAVRVINSHTANERFFVEVSFNSVHMPFQPPPTDMVLTDEFKVTDAEWPLNQGRFENAQAMMESLDVAIGHVLAHMDSEIMADTVFIVAGDNGTARPALKLFDADAAPVLGASGRLGQSYKYVLGLMDDQLPPGVSPALGPKKTKGRMKSSCFERGLRAPLIIWDPSGDVIVNPSRESTVQVDIVDLMPTVLDLMGVDYDSNALDGVSVLPALKDEVDRSSHKRQYSFSETYSPTGTGPVLNPRTDPNFLGEWTPSMGVVTAGSIVSYHNNIVRFYKALRDTAHNPYHLDSENGWQTLAFKQRSFLMDLAAPSQPGTYKIVRNYFEDDSEFVDRFYKLYDSAFDPVDPIEAYELDQLGAYATEYHQVRTRLDDFLSAQPPSPPTF